MTKSIAVIGAGLAGVTLARSLTSKANVTVFEKSRGVSGRMSTRRTDQFEFDHGAQYFTAKDPKFISAVKQGMKDGYIEAWTSQSVYAKSTGLEPDIGGGRYVSVPRMNSWIKASAEGLDIHVQYKVTSLRRDGGKWSLSFDGYEDIGGFDWVVMAAPSVQVDALFPETFVGKDALQAVKMAACFALMIGLEHNPHLPWDTLRSELGPAAWIAVNSAKPKRPEDRHTLMVHSSADWSEAHVDADRVWVESEMMKAAANLTGLDLKAPTYKTLHRWLYANVSLGAEEAYLIDSKQNLMACGDWCLGGRVEGAYLSGLAAAKRLQDELA